MRRAAKHPEVDERAEASSDSAPVAKRPAGRGRGRGQSRGRARGRGKGKQATQDEGQEKQKKTALDLQNRVRAKPQEQEGKPPAKKAKAVKDDSDSVNSFKFVICMHGLKHFCFDQCFLQDPVAASVTAEMLELRDSDELNMFQIPDDAMNGKQKWQTKFFLHISIMISRF